MEVAETNRHLGDILEDILAVGTARQIPIQCDLDHYSKNKQTANNKKWHRPVCSQTSLFWLYCHHNGFSFGRELQMWNPIETLYCWTRQQLGSIKKQPLNTITWQYRRLLPTCCCKHIRYSPIYLPLFYISDILYIRYSPYQIFTHLPTSPLLQILSQRKLWNEWELVIIGCCWSQDRA